MTNATSTLPATVTPAREDHPCAPLSLVTSPVSGDDLATWADGSLPRMSVMGQRTLWEDASERHALAMHEAVRIRRAVKRVREVRRENAAREATTYPHHGAPVMLDSSSRSGVICAGVRVI